MFVSLQQQRCPGSEGDSQKGACRLVETLLHDKVRKCISPCMRHILQSNHAIDPTVWKQEVEFVPVEFEASGRVSHQGCLAYGRQEADETLGWYLGVPKLGASS
jgi:hypothetical protein